MGKKRSVFKKEYIKNKFRDRKVVILDDDETFGKNLITVLKKIGIACIHFTQPEKALDYIEEKSEKNKGGFESVLLILDLQLNPKKESLNKWKTLGGVLFLNELRERKKSIPVIIASEYLIEHIPVEAIDYFKEKKSLQS